MERICNSTRVQNYRPPTKGKVITILKNIAEHIRYGSKHATEIVNAAYRTGWPGEGLCLGWVKNVFNNAGLKGTYCFGQSSANACYRGLKNTGTPIHTDRNIPTGAVVFGTGAGEAGYKWGHIGICVQGEDSGKTIKIRDSINSGLQTVTLNEWIGQQQFAPHYKGYVLYEEIVK